jgi:hypothetical protein
MHSPLNSTLHIKGCLQRGRDEMMRGFHVFCGAGGGGGDIDWGVDWDGAG